MKRYKIINRKGIDGAQLGVPFFLFFFLHVVLSTWMIPLMAGILSFGGILVIKKMYHDSNRWTELIRRTFHPEGTYVSGREKIDIRSDTD